MNKNKTFAPNPNKIKRNWHFIDATDQILGRLATDIATKLIGKNKPEYTPNANLGDTVVVINAEKVAVTGKKEQDKIYYHHTGYPGGIKAETLGKLRERKPEEIIKRAVSGMLPKNKLRQDRVNSLYVYKGDKHPHTAQESK